MLRASLENNWTDLTIFYRKNIKKRCPKSWKIRELSTESVFLWNFEHHNDYRES